jgi:hypothetical protein
MLKKRKIFLNIFIILILAVTFLPVNSAAEEINSEILIYSAEPEGVIAAVAAAEEGKKVTLVMTREKPGGLMTYAALNFLDLNYDQKSNNINQGLFNRWHQKVGSAISFSPQKAETAFSEMLAAEENIQVINSVELQQVKTKNKNIESIKVKKDNQLYNLTADYYIDVKPALLKQAVRNNKYQASHFRDDHAWGFSNFGKSYRPQADNLRLRGLNIVFIENNGGYDAYINALLLFNVDPLSESSLQQAKKKAAEEAELILSYLQRNLEGFSGASLDKLPPELYRRESRHFLTEYQLKAGDLFRQKIFPDTITLASYPLDYQA